MASRVPRPRRRPPKSRQQAPPPNRSRQRHRRRKATPDLPPRRTSMKRYLIAGLLVWVPLGITIWVLHFLLTSLDQVLIVLPESLQPRTLFGFDIPGLGVVVAFLILFGTGVVAANFFGQRLIRAWEALLGRIPFVKSIYSSVKQVSDTLLSDKGQAFRKALLVEFPRPGSWTIAFQTGTPAVRNPQLISHPDAAVPHRLPGTSDGLPENDLKRTDYCGRIDRRFLGQS